MVKMFYAAKYSDQQVWDWVYIALNAIFDRIGEFFGRAANDFRSAKRYEVSVFGKKKTQMVVGFSDSREFSKFSRSKHGCKAGVVIQMNSKGNVIIHTRECLRLNLDDVARAIRIAEMDAQSSSFPRIWKDLHGPGTLDCCIEWHYFPEGKMLLNGSDTAEKPPTKLTLDAIAELVSRALDPDRFDPELQESCQRGICNSTKKNPCSLYGYGFRRCCSIRKQQMQNSSGNPLRLHIQPPEVVSQ
jgi:hypothetical protein